MKLAPDVSPVVREIYRRMTEAGMTANSLAVKAGRNQTYFRDLFRGRSRTPNVEYLPAIAEALGCKVADLLGEPEVASSQPGDHEVYQPLDEVALVGLWRLLSDDGKQRIMRHMVRELAALKARG